MTDQPKAHAVYITPDTDRHHVGLVSATIFRHADGSAYVHITTKDNPYSKRRKHADFGLTPELLAAFREALS